MYHEGLRILLVDDIQIVLQQLQILLRELKQVGSIEAVEKAKKALLLLDHFKPDIVILDINMPDMNGVDLLKQIRAGKDIDPVVIMLTNNTFSVYREECMRLGADYFLDKSRDFQSIPALIEKIYKEKLPRFTGLLP